MLVTMASLDLCHHIVGRLAENIVQSRVLRVVLHCSCGGVVVTSGDGKIVCSNTLDERLQIAYTQNLPMIRGTFFGVEQPVREEMHL